MKLHISFDLTCTCFKFLVCCMSLVKTTTLKEADCSSEKFTKSFLSMLRQGFLAFSQE